VWPFPNHTLHRRLEAAKTSGWRHIGQTCENVDDNVKLQMTLIENLQRKEMSGCVKGYLLKQLASNFGLTFEKVANLLEVRGLGFRNHPT
jgi:ParB-like chromosome segregation protein Spo0J